MNDLAQIIGLSPDGDWEDEMELTERCHSDSCPHQMGEGCHHKPDCTHYCEDGHFSGDDMVMAEIGTGWPAKWEAALAESEALRKALHALLPPAYEGFSKAVTDPSLVKFVPDWLRAWRRGCELLGLPTDLDTMDSQPTLAALAPTVAASEATEVHGREKAAIEREAGVTADRVYVAYLAPSPATEAER